MRIRNKYGDQEVSFDEFKDQMESYLKAFLTTQDENKDGLVDKVGKPILNLNLFLTIVNNTFEFFGENEDEIVSTIVIRRDGHKTKLSTLIGGGGFINFPSPIFVLYTIIDPDRNEELSLKEVTEFITKAFNIIDRNDDCLIDLNDVIATLADSKLPIDFQVGVRLLGEHYLNLVIYFFEYLVDITDKNKDNKMSFEELIAFDDFTRLNPMVDVALHMSKPNQGTLNYLIGAARSQDREEVSDLWLNTLQNFLGYFKDQTEPTKSKCYLAL